MGVREFVTRVLMDLKIIDWSNGFRRLTTVELKKAEEKARNILLIGGDIVTLECEGISVSIRRCPECRYMRSVVDYIEGLDVCNDCMALRMIRGTHRLI